MPLGVMAPVSMLRYKALLAYAVPLLRVAVVGPSVISRAYGSVSSLLGLKRLPLASTSATKPVAEPLTQLALYGQFGP